jgi:hypothetical protein
MADKDRVQVPSRRKDGTVDQTDDYEIIGDPETAKTAIAEQLGQMKVSEADQAARAATGTDDEVAGPTPEEQARIDEHQALMAEGEAEAESEVAAHTTSEEPAPTTKGRRKASVETATTRSGE